MKLIELNSAQFMQLLNKLDACDSAKEWADGKSAKEVINTVYRGDWLLWLYKKKVAPSNLQELTLAKGHSANTVRHLMKDERSIKAVDAAIAFGEGKTTRDELLMLLMLQISRTNY